MTGTLPETPEGIALLLWLAALTAGHEPGNNPRVASLLNLYSECLSATRGRRPAPDCQPH